MTPTCCRGHFLVIGICSFIFLVSYKFSLLNGDEKTKTVSNPVKNQMQDMLKKNITQSLLE